MSGKMRWLMALTLGVLLAGCAPAATTGLTVTDAWARSSPMIDRAGAVYLTIQNGGSEADRLVAVSAAVAATVELHQTTEVDGMMQMSPVAAIEVPAGGQAELAPGGFHIMLIDLTQELKAGDTLELTLTFEQAGEIKVTAEVRDQ